MVRVVAARLGFLPQLGVSVAAGLGELASCRAVLGFTAEVVQLLSRQRRMTTGDLAVFNVDGTAAVPFTAFALAAANGDPSAFIAFG